MATNDWYERRCTAIHMLRSGCSTTEVAHELKRPLSWVGKWRTRFEREGWVGMQGHSQAPQRPRQQLPVQVRQAILRARSELEAEAADRTGLQFVSAAAVRGRLRQKAVAPLPSNASIERVLRAAGMTRPRSPHSKPEVIYPHLHPDCPHDLIQVDIVPHFLTGGQAMACFNGIDVVSRYPTGRACEQRRAEDAVDFLIHVWQEIGLAHYTQVDNEACFSGGFTHAGVLGQVVRLALWVGVELVFSPLYHPESNGTVERFHQDYDRHVWDLLDLPHPAAVTPQGNRFFEQYRHSPHHTALNGQTPAEVHAQPPPQRLPADFTRPKGKLPLTEGRVHFMRRVSPTGTVAVLNLEWSVPRPQPDRGVWVTIEFTCAGAWLSIYDAAPDAHDRTCLATYPFPLREAVQPRPGSQPTPDQERIPSGQADAMLTPGNLILSHWQLLPPANLTSLPQALPHLMARAIRSTVKATAHFISTMF
jgi:transposase InsO family protein